MQNILVLFFLGLVQGITEFLPVSSSGHLVLLSKLFGLEENLFVSILLHVATLLSIFVVFWREILNMIKHPLGNDTMKIVVATIPTCIIALIFMPVVKASFSGAFLPYCFLATAILLFVSELLSNKSDKPFEYKNAVIMGIAQGFAIFPGISRSGSTICAGLLSGVEKGECAKYSFLMSIPIILASMLMEIVDITKEVVIIEFSFWELAVGFVTAFLVGIFAIKFMTKLVEGKSLKWFSIYLLLIGIASFWIV